MELVGDTAIGQRIGGLRAGMDDGWEISAFESVFLEYYGRMVSVIRRMVGDPGRAEELASETFLRLFEQPPQRLENIGGWLYRTATRLGLDCLRSAARARRHDWTVAVAQEPDSPLDSVLRRETCLKVRKALARLKPVQAQLLTLRSHGLSYKELAAALGIKPQSVGPMLLRAEAAFEKAYRRAAARRR